MSMAASHITGLFPRPPPPHRSINFAGTTDKLKTTRKWLLLAKERLVEQRLKCEPKSVDVDMKRMVEIMYQDLPHLLDDNGIDRMAYDEAVKFRDPITKYDSIDGYLYNIALVKTLFTSDFQIHWVKQTGPYEISTRWTVMMTFKLLPWRPELVVFTGTSVMEINPKNGKIRSHFDYWDSVQNNEYFSVEGLLDVLKQLRYYKKPDLEMPKYQILKRTANYEVRKYVPCIVVETVRNELSGSMGFNYIAGFIFGKNSKQENIVKTKDTYASKVAIQILLPSDKDMSSLPVTVEDGITLRNVKGGGIAAVMKFGGKAAEDIIIEKEQILRSSLLKDGLAPKPGCSFATYNDPRRTWSFTMRNEILIWLEEFSMD